MGRIAWEVRWPEAVTQLTPLKEDSGGIATLTILLGSDLPHCFLIGQTHWEDTGQGGPMTPSIPVNL